ncbi:MAG: DUF2490 domain-containing protein [Flavobacterium sp.]|uniref:DUF2490 domain-containing protein n=1 Tax=Flavobacterium sp. TaxID=239 RepID=UPI003BC6B371
MRRLLFIVLLLFFCYSYSQELKQNQRVWFAYMGQYKVSNHWGYHIEAQFRLDNQLKQNQQNLFRIGAIYYLNSNKSFTAGYGLITTYNEGVDDYFKENRLWEQYQYSKNWNESKNTIIHRMRLENRWVEKLILSNNSVVSLGSSFQNRFRYLNRNLFRLLNFKSTNEELYAILQNEVFLNVGDNKVNSKLIDQNRFLVGLGLNYNNNIRLEFGYMNHFITSTSATNVMNHTISVSLFQNLDLQKH